VIKERKIGRSGLLNLNLDNDLTYYYLAISNLQRIPKHILFPLELIKHEFSQETPFFSIVVFGSYAVSEQKENSDLDIAIFVENYRLKSLNHKLDKADT